MLLAVVLLCAAAVALAGYGIGYAAGQRASRPRSAQWCARRGQMLLPGPMPVPRPRPREPRPAKR